MRSGEDNGSERLSLSDASGDCRGGEDAVFSNEKRSDAICGCHFNDNLKTSPHRLDASKMAEQNCIMAIDG